MCLLTGILMIATGETALKGIFTLFFLIAVIITGAKVYFNVKYT